MNEHQLRCFVSVAKYSNFSKAGEDLYMTQAAVTYQIAAIEKELKIRLFDRSNGRVSLTEAGSVFLDSAKGILDDIDHARRRAQETARGMCDSVSIGCHGDVAMPMMPELLSEFRKGSPGVSVSLAQRMTSDLVEDMNTGVVDVCFLTGYGDYIASLSWLECKLLFTDVHCAVVPKNHPLSTRSVVSSAELNAEKKILLAEKELFDHEEDAEEFDDVLFLSDPQSVRILVEAGYGISVCVSHVAPADNPRVACVPIEGSSMGIYLCTRKGDRREAVSSFVRIVEAYPWRDAADIVA